MLDIQAIRIFILLAIMQVRAPSKTRPQVAKSYSQAVHLQDLLLKDADNPKTTAAVRAQVARAFCELEERKRILRMRPKPKDVDVLELAKLKAAQRRERAALVTELEPGDEPAEPKPGYRMQPAHPTPSDSPATGQ